MMSMNKKPPTGTPMAAPRKPAYERPTNRLLVVLLQVVTKKRTGFGITSSRSIEYEQTQKVDKINDLSFTSSQ